jgi:ribonucleoside-diphosphate reductase alpha chain
MGQILQSQNILKRDGQQQEFDLSKLQQALVRASDPMDTARETKAADLTKEVLQRINKVTAPLTSELLDDIVVETLMEKGETKTTKAYILYRHKKQENKKRSAFILGIEDANENLNFSNQALKILETRYLLKNQHGKVLETPKKMLERVANNIALADKKYGGNIQDVQDTAKEFYQVMAQLKFLPNSPTLMNAGTKIQQLSSCFVLPVDDTMGGIFGSLKDAAIIHQRGSGTGFAFSRLRPKGDFVKDNMGVAAGAVDFMKIYDTALEFIKQGGVRKGANMAVLRVDHPDIIRFIESKRNQVHLRNFNISVAITDNFMRAVEENRDYYLTNPRTGKYVDKLRARDVFAVITQNAWKTGDPGLIFIDEINRKHPAKHLGEIETTNQCGEAPLLPYEGCVLGSLNLNKFINQDQSDIMWDDLQTAVNTAVHFLDNVIDMNSYPKKSIEENTKKTRKFGLGIMGLADALCTLKIPYNSEEGLALADRLMSFIKSCAYQASSALAGTRGVCPAWKGSDHERLGRKMRNMTCLSISPTGTISILAGASSGCEPLFALSYQKTVFGDTDFIHVNKQFERVAKARGFYSSELLRNLSRVGSVQEMKEVPKDVREVFVTSQNISPEWHVKMQSTLQKHVDNSISKTVNFPRSAAIKDVETVYLLAWKAKCKGITTYRDGSYEDQVINIG